MELTIHQSLDTLINRFATIRSCSVSALLVDLTDFNLSYYLSFNFPEFSFRIAKMPPKISVGSLSVPDTTGSRSEPNSPDGEPAQLNGDTSKERQAILKVDQV